MKTRLRVRTTPLHLPEADADPSALLNLLPAGAPLSWVRRGDGLVGWGEIVRIDAAGTTQFADAEASWNELTQSANVDDDVNLPGTGLVAFGSFAFDYASSAGGALIVPEVIIGRRGAHAWITRISLDSNPEPGPLTLHKLHQNVSAITAPGPISYTTGALDDDAWCTVVEDGIARIKASDLDKIVLARDVQAHTSAPLDPRWLLNRLADQYAGCWTFSVDGLVGATPELLVRSEKGLVISRVLAGTVRRTGNDSADLEHAAHLSHSSKDLEEHEYAVASVARAFEPFCSSSNVPEAPFVLHLPNVLHLATDVTGVLSHSGTSSLTLAAALHPTAAVCGTPTDAARELIREIEGLDRARYAGPVGWLGADGDGEWGIALRSAELDAADPHRLRLFAGCGIVAASVPAEELAETEAKLEPMRYALG